MPDRWSFFRLLYLETFSINVFGSGRDIFFVPFKFFFGQVDIIGNYYCINMEDILMKPNSAVEELSVIKEN